MRALIKPESVARIPTSSAPTMPNYPVLFSAVVLGFDILLAAQGQYCVRWHKPDADGKVRWSVCHLTMTGAVLAALKNEDGRNAYLEEYYATPGRYSGD